LDFSSALQSSGHWSSEKRKAPQMKQRQNQVPFRDKGRFLPE
jgi:hypothetical protein